MKAASKKKKSIKEKDDETPRPYKCSHPGCNMSYPSPASLGGHTSKAHPGWSLVYKQKIETRKSRATERDLLQEAKKLFLAQRPQLSESDLITHRQDIQKIKKTLKRQKVSQTSSD